MTTLGFLFEALCERDLKIYSETFNGQLYHYQDYDNHKIDAVVELENGDWCAFEVNYPPPSKQALKSLISNDSF